MLWAYGGLLNRTTINRSNDPERRLLTKLTQYLFVGLALLGTLVPAAADAQLEVSGDGKDQMLASDQFEGEYRARYELFAVKCTKCHEMARPISALQTGITPITGSEFDKAGMKNYVIKMMRKPKSGIAKAEAKEILLFLMYARELAKAESE